MSSLFKTILDEKFDIKDAKVLGIYIYGSRLYGIHTDISDHDYMVVIEPIEGVEEYFQYNTEALDIHFMTPAHYQKLLDEHNIMAMEAYFQDTPILKYSDVSFTLNKDTLRRAISAKASNSWVKAKKKCLDENECDYIGYKSLYHSFRILNYGIQIAQVGKIHDYQSANESWTWINRLVNEGRDILYIQEDMKSTHLTMQTTFRKFAPKDIK